METQTLPKLKTKYVNKIGITEKLQTRNIGIPKNYHCSCEYCTKNYLGEIFHNGYNTYYSQRARNYYYDKDAGTHIAPGHFLGYRWAIQEFTEEGDWVFDPTVGTGTAIVEAINHGRHGVGIELEFPKITQANIDHQFKRETDKPTGEYVFLHGNAKELSSLLQTEACITPETLQLVINGTPYPTLGGVSSDAPERKNFKKDENGKTIIANNRTFDYGIEDNFGKKKGDEYWKLIRGMYSDCVPFMKEGAKMVILIKDMVQNKKPYLLHKMIIDDILENNDQLRYYGMYMHAHIPTTMFMNTYHKQYPDAKQIPLYQTGIILEKHG